MPPGSADVITTLEASGTLTRSAGEVAAAEPLTGGGLRVTSPTAACMTSGGW
jgi:hypothetical protein